MGNYVLSCCSTADLTREQLDERDIKYIYFHFDLGDKEYQDDLGDSISFKEFYDGMREGLMTKTSQINASEYIEYFESFLKEGKDVLHVTLAAGLSGTYNSAMIAKEELEEKYPDRKLYIVDSAAASGGYGLLMFRLAELKKQGLSVDELHTWCEEHKLEANHWFFTTELKYLIRGGRLSKTAGTVGSLLNICPLLDVNADGKLSAKAKIRGKKKVIKATVDKMLELCDNGVEYSGDCIINHADCEEDAQAVISQIEERIPALKGKIFVNYIGTTIGSHTGPGTVAVFFWGKKREDHENE